MKKQLDSYLLSRRRISGLTQTEFTYLLGRKSGSVVSRLETGQRDPSLAIAFACEIIFGAPPAELFPGLFSRTEEIVLTRTYDLYERPQGNPSKATRLKLDLLEDAFERRKERTKSESI
jgi:transcriptional regulator with XRE-family HTH domain